MAIFRVCTSFRCCHCGTFGSKVVPVALSSRWRSSACTPGQIHQAVHTLNRVGLTNRIQLRKGKQKMKHNWSPCFSSIIHYQEALIGPLHHGHISRPLAVVVSLIRAWHHQVSWTWEALTIDQLRGWSMVWAMERPVIQTTFVAVLHFLHLLGSTCSKPGPRTQVIVCYAFVWPEFSAPLGLKIFHVHTFRLKTLHFEQFWTAFGNPSKGKTPERPFWNPTNYKTNYIHLFNLFHFLHLLGSTCSKPGPRTQVIVCYAFVWPEFSAPLGL